MLSAIFIRPFTNATVPVSQSRKLQRPYRICAKRLNISGGFNFQKNNCSSSGRKNQTILQSFNGAKGSHSFEEEALVKGSVDNGGAGLEATLNHLSKWFVTALFAAIGVWRHDSVALWAATGALFNTILSAGLKKILNQERPISTRRSDPGMPSSHAQSISYIVIFLNLSMLERYGVNEVTMSLSGLFFVVGFYFSWLRVSQQDHTLSQVIVGALLGFFFSILWFWSWNAFVFSLYKSYFSVKMFVVLSAIGFSGMCAFRLYESLLTEEM